MKQTQQIGHQSQEMGVERVQEKSNIHQPPHAPTMKVDEKPAITDDEGNELNKLESDDGKGYNEHQLTDPGADHPAADPQATTGTDTETPNTKNEQHDGHKPWGEQDRHDDINRARQAENVRG